MDASDREVAKQGTETGRHADGAPDRAKRNTTAAGVLPDGATNLHNMLEGKWRHAGSVSFEGFRF